MVEVKKIKGVTVFRSNKDAERARRKALIADAQWKTALIAGLAGAILCWGSLALACLINSFVLFYFAIIVSVATYIYSEAVYGKFIWTKVFTSIMSNHSGVFIFLFFIEIICLLWCLLVFAVFGMFFGCGIFLILADRHYIRMTIDATEEYGFDDSEADLRRAKIEQRNRENAEKIKSNAKKAANVAVSAAQSGADTVTKKATDVSRTAFNAKKTSVQTDDESWEEDAYPVEDDHIEVAQKVWFCPQCGAKNEGNFCSSCGTHRP